MKVAVIGAGPAGLTAAYKLAAEGVDVDVFEASGEVGGMCRTFELWGHKVDLGPHRFYSSDSRVNEIWLDIVGNDYAMVDRLTRIYYKNEFFPYPLKPFETLRKLGLFDSALCLASYVREKMRSTTTDAETFENWVVGRFGRRLFDIFFKTYSEKLWGISCSDLDSDFAAQRIKRLSLLEAIKSSFLGKKNGKHKTLVDRFAYPLGGTGMVYERMAERVEKDGGRIHLTTPIASVVHENRTVCGLRFQDGLEERYDRVISTMPLTLMVKSLGEMNPEVEQAIDELTFRNTVLVYLNVDSAEPLFPDQWVYVHSPHLSMGRMTNFRNWVPELYGEQRTTVIACELWCDSDDATWFDDDARHIGNVSSQLTSTGLLRGAKILDGHVVRVPRCYPVYRRGYKDSLAKIVEHLKTFTGLTAIGRYGSFKYNNQDHSILMGLLAAREIIDQTDHDLQSINTDYESYQEQSVITETGLQTASGELVTA